MHGTTNLKKKPRARLSELLFQYAYINPLLLRAF